MNVLWVVNHKMKDLALELGEEQPISGSWLEEMSKTIVNKKQIKLYVVCPSKTDGIKLVKNGITYYTLKMSDYDKFLAPSKALINAVEDLVSDINPNIIHLQGSEFAFNLAFLRNKNVPTLLTIQGLISQIVSRKYFFAGINDIGSNFYFKYINNISEYIKYIRNKFRAKSEIMQIKSCNYITGRTSWDRANTYFINKDARYFHLQETIRAAFFDANWTYSRAEQHTIFAAGGFGSPLKGFHNILLAVALLKDEFPNIILKVPGPNLLESRGRFGYKKLLVNLIKVKKLERNIRFLGNLNDQQMAHEFSTAHAYVMGSSIENSSNTLGEAMTVGTPCVVSFVGGTSSIITDEYEGLYYRFGDIKHMAWQIRRFFLDKKHTDMCSHNCKERAKEQYFNTNSYSELLKVYKEIVTK